MSVARTVTELLGPRPRMTLVIAEAQVAEIWVEGRTPLITIRDYDWGETDPEACRDSEGFPFTKINWRDPAWALGLSLYPPEKETPMANALGYVSETKSGFEGTLAMMNLSAAIRIEKNAEKTEEGHPDYRIYAGETSTEIGGGWMRKSKASGRDYVSLTLADPQIGPRRIFANLAPVKGKKGRHVILWNARD